MRADELVTGQIFLGHRIKEIQYDPYEEVIRLILFATSDFYLEVDTDVSSYLSTLCTNTGV